MASLNGVDSVRSLGATRVLVGLDQVPYEALDLLFQFCFFLLP